MGSRQYDRYMADQYHEHLMENPMTVTEAPASQAFQTATRIAVAIQKKFPKHTQYVREIKTGDFSFFEIALRPANGSHVDDITTAYSTMFFEEIDETNIKERAGRILKDFKILMGVPL